MHVRLEPGKRINLDRGRRCTVLPRARKLCRARERFLSAATNERHNVTAALQRGALRAPRVLGAYRAGERGMAMPLFAEQ